MFTKTSAKVLESKSIGKYVAEAKYLFIFGYQIKEVKCGAEGISWNLQFAPGERKCACIVCTTLTPGERRPYVQADKIMENV